MFPSAHYIYQTVNYYSRVEECNDDIAEKISKAWFLVEPRMKRCHQNILRIETLSPFLYRTTHNLPKLWLKLCYDVGLLIDNDLSNVVRIVIESEMMEAIDIITNAVNVFLSRIDRDNLPRILHAFPPHFHNQDTEEILARCESSEDIRNFTSGVPASKNKALIAINLVIRQFLQHCITHFVCDEDQVLLFCEQTDSTEVQGLKNKGNTFFKKGKYTEAIDIYTIALNKCPYNYILYGNRARAYIHLGQFREARGDCYRAVTIKPDWVKGHYIHVETLVKLGNMEMACKESLRALAICSKDDENKNQLKTLQDQHKGLKSGAGLVDAPVESLPKSMSTEKLSDDELSMSGQLSPSSSGAAKLIPKSLNEVPQNTNPQPHIDKDDSVRGIDDTNKENASTENDPAPKKPKKKRTKKKEPQRKPAAKDPLQTEDCKQKRSLLQQHIQQGSVAMLDNFIHKAIQCYKEAYDIIQSSPSSSNADVMDEIELVVFLYSFSTALIKSKSVKDLKLALEILESIQREHSTIRFPLAYYGFGQWYISQNRFFEAIPYLLDGLSMVIRIKSDVAFAWPETRVKIPESDCDKIQNIYRDLIKFCHYCPQPNARCRYDYCLDEAKPQIYFTDPAFCGFCRLKCSLGCVTEYHIACWKKIRSALEEVFDDKDILKKPCLTPDCSGVYVHIEIFGSDALVKKVWSCEKPIRPGRAAHPSKQKLKPSVINLEKRLAKAEERKEKKLKIRKRLQEEAEEIRQETEAINRAELLQINNTTRTKPETSDDVAGIENIREYHDSSQLPAAYVLKKEPDSNEIVVPKPTETKKKKKKPEKTEKPSIELGFHSGRRHMVPPVCEDGFDPYDDTLSYGDHLYDFTPPMFSPHLMNDTDNCRQTTFDYMHEILRLEGPMHVSDTSLVCHINNLPVECQLLVAGVGGIRPFLLNWLEFASVGEYVCLVTDVELARRKQETERNLAGVQHNVSLSNRPPATEPVTEMARLDLDSNKDSDDTRSLTSSEDEFILVEDEDEISDDGQGNDPHVVVLSDGAVGPLQPSRSSGSSDEYLMSLFEGNGGFEDFASYRTRSPLTETTNSPHSQNEYLPMHELTDNGFDFATSDQSIDVAYPMWSAGNVPVNLSPKQTRKTIRIVDPVTSKEVQFIPVALTPDPVVMTSKPLVWTPEPVALTPDPIALTPDPVGLTPDPIALTPDSVVLTPDSVVLTPEPVALTPEPVALTPDSVVLTPEPVALIPDSVVLTPEPIVLTPDPVVLTPEPVALTPEPVALTSDSVVLTPEPVSLTPEPVALTPEPIALTPEPVSLTPELIALTPDSVSLTPEPEIVTLADSPQPSTFNGTGVDVACQSTITGQDPCRSIYESLKHDYDKLNVHVFQVKSSANATIAQLHTNIKNLNGALQFQQNQCKVDLNGATAKNINLQSELNLRQKVNDTLSCTSSEAEKSYKEELDKLRAANKSLHQTFKKISEKQHIRAVSAEVEYLKCKQLFATHQFQQHLADAEKIRAQFQYQLRMRPNDEYVKDGLSKWESCCAEYVRQLAEMGWKYSKQINIIEESGVEMSELPVVEFTKNIASGLPLPRVTPPPVASVSDVSQMSVDEVPSRPRVKAGQFSAFALPQPFFGGPMPQGSSTEGSSAASHTSAVPSGKYPVGLKKPIPLSYTTPQRQHGSSPVPDNRPSTPKNDQSSLLYQNAMKANDHVPSRGRSPALPPPVLKKTNIPPPPSPPRLPSSSENFEKLLLTLMDRFHGYDRPRIMQLIVKVRQLNGNSLKGLKADEIISRVTNLIADEHYSNGSKTAARGWDITSQRQSDYKADQEDPCLICHDPMKFNTIQKLDCGHIFHKVCLKTWLDEQKTCPTCRKLVLLPDEFPKL